MRIDYLFAQFGQLVAKLWPLEDTVVTGNEPKGSTLAGSASGVVGWSSGGYFGIRWPGHAYHVLSDVTIRVPSRIAKMLWRLDPNLVIRSVLWW